MRNNAGNGRKERESGNHTNPTSHRIQGTKLSWGVLNFIESAFYLLVVAPVVVIHQPSPLRRMQNIAIHPIEVSIGGISFLYYYLLQLEHMITRLVLVPEGTSVIVILWSPFFQF